jgi:hypothetical protein
LYAFGIVVPADPYAAQLALFGRLVSQRSQGLEDAGNNAGGHIPGEALEIAHPVDGVGDESPQHLAAGFLHHILRDQLLGAIANAERFSVLPMVVV